MKLKNSFLSIFAMMVFCLSATTAWAGQLSLNENDDYFRMEGAGTDTLTIGNGVQQFTVESYRIDDDAVLVLKAPEGRVFQFGPFVAMYETVPVRVFDGADTNATLLFSKTVHNYFGNTCVDGYYGRYVSSGQYAAIALKKGVENTFVLKTIVTDPNENHSISVGRIYGYNFWYHDDYYERDEYMYSVCANGCGSVSLTVESATVNTPVSFSATPGENRVLNRVVVKDGDKSIAVTGGTWYTSNDATFTMPATDVTIEPYYARGWTARDGLTIETPYNEILEVDIPSEAESFTVNRGEVASASSMAPIKPLILRAPAGKLMQLEDNEGHPYYSDDFSAYIGAFEDPVAVDAPRMIGNTSSGEVLTLLEYTHVVKLVNASDFPHKISIVPRGDCGGNVTHNLTNLASVVAGTEVSMKVEPEEGCALNEVFIAVGSENDTTRVRITGGSWFTSEEFSFTMPFANIFVIVNYVKKTKMNAENGLYVNMPKVDPLTVSIPEGVQSFEVREPRTPYNGNVLTLTAPENTKLQISGLAYGESGDLLKIYDGANTGATELWSGKAGPVDVISSGNSLTLYLKGGPVFPQLTVKVVDPNTKYSVIIADMYNGTVTPNVSKAKPGDVVTLTAHPDTQNGIVLQSIECLVNNVNIPVTGGTWYHNQAQFVMPEGDVYVYATFNTFNNYRLGIAMPNSDTVQAVIPEIVPSFEIYSDGYYSYPNNSDGTLVLTAPEGLVLSISGNACTADDGDSLVIYDGADANAEKLVTITGQTESCNYWDSNVHIFSSGRNLTLHFKSNEGGTNYGLNLGVVSFKKTSFTAVDVYEFLPDYKLARINDGYEGSDTVKIPDAIAVRAIEYNRTFTPLKPSTIVLPFTLPEGTKINAKFYYLKKIVQDGCSWRATMKYIGSDNLPQANTPYAIILDKGEETLAFDLNEGEAILQTGPIAENVDETDKWIFKGVYSYKQWAKGDTTLGLAYALAGRNEENISKGEFGRIAAGAYIYPMRSYLTKRDASVRLECPAAVRAWDDASYSASFSSVNTDVIGVEFVDENEKTTAVGRLNTATGEFKIDRWYDLKGRKVNNVNRAAKGAYYGKRTIGNGTKK